MSSPDALVGVLGLEMLSSFKTSGAKGDLS
jgi:hypothetical protein